MEKLRVLSLFSGCGAFEKALENLGIPHEVVGYCEIDKYAAKAYSVLHGIDESMNYGDITKINVDELPEFDLVTYGFPCQDISVAGKQAGMTEGTRSGLVSYPLKFIAARKPKYAICENVKNLVGKKFREAFDGILADLESMGYTNHWKVLNSKNFGVPQNRERLFLVSIRNDLDTPYTFPEGYDSGVRLRDILESVVDEKYYIDDAKSAKLIEEIVKRGDSLEYGGLYTGCSDAFFRGTLDGMSRTLKSSNHDAAVVVPVTSIDMKGIYPSSTRGGVYKTNGICHCLDHNCNIGVPVPCDPQVLRPQRTDYGKAIRKQYEAGEVKESRHNMTVMVPRTDGISNTVTTVTKDNLVLLNEPITIIDDLYAGREARVYTEIAPTLRSERHGLKVVCVGNELNVLGRLPWINNDMRSRVYGVDGISPTLNVCGGGNNEPKVLIESPPMRWRIRKLTPLECFRLQGFADEDHAALVSAGISNSQMYKIAGNSITVNVLEDIFKELLCPTM